jgi:hypothetical protein
MLQWNSKVTAIMMVALLVALSSGLANFTWSFINFTW